MGEDANLNAFLSKDSQFDGKLSFEGTVRIDGRFNGEIFTEGVLVVGEQARVDAEIEVGTLVHHGEIHGNVTADDAVELRNPSRLFGNIQTPNLVIERGVVFEGACKMREEQEDGEQ